MAGYFGDDELRIPRTRRVRGPLDFGDASGGVVNPPSDVGVPGPTDEGALLNPPSDRRVPGPTDWGAEAPEMLRALTTPQPASQPSWTPTYQSSAMPGWDQGKWSDPTHQTVKYQAGRFMTSQPSTEAGMQALATYLRNQGYGVTYGGSGDTMTLSGKEIGSPAEIDMLRAGGAGGWQWLPTAPEAAGGGAGAGTGAPLGTGGGSPWPGSGASQAGASGSGGGQGTAWTPQTTGYQPDGAIFDDPIGSWVEQFVRARVDALGQNVSDADRAQYAQMLRTQIGGLLSPQASSPEGQYDRILQEQIDYLDQPTFSASEDAAIQAASFDGIERDRQVARQRVLEELGRRNMTPGSGPAIAALQSVDQHFDTLKQQARQQLNTYALDANRSRRQQRVQTGETAANVAAGRRQQALATGESLVNLGTTTRNEYNQNQMTALALLGALSDLESNRFNQSLALTGESAGTQNSMGQTLLGLIQNAQNQGLLNSQQAAALWGQIGQSVGNLVNQWPTK
jgi:hypothetical protein